jgi:DNA-binding MarR family transcriptional regulator
MGMTRQGVQRIADLVVEQGLAEYVDNPAHRRSKLVRVTDEGVAAIRRIDPGHAAMAERLRKEMGRQRLEQALDALHDLSAAFDRLEAQDAAASG